jgi:tRNA-(ms[2]io[6]A)-hydroxylase
MKLKVQSSEDWLRCVLADFETFLQDHAANERKASSMAMSMVTHYPDRTQLTRAMIDLALEELNHFRQVYRLIEARGSSLTADVKDHYVNALRQHLRKTSQDYFLDRLLSAAVIEARGAERFEMIGNALDDAKLANFYQSLARSESQHHQLFLDLALTYFDPSEVETRLEFWLTEEAAVLAALPIRPRLH